MTTKTKPFKLSQTTINMAEKRGISIQQYEGPKGVIEIQFCRIEEDGEPLDEYHARYRVDEEGLFFMDSCFNGEEWPNWIPSDLALRSLISSGSMSQVMKTT